jgi:hypothetical protein
MTVEERKRQVYFLVNEIEPDCTKHLGSDTIAALNRAFSQSMESQHNPHQRYHQTGSRRRRRNPQDIQFLSYVPSTDSSSLRQKYNRVRDASGSENEAPVTPIEFYHRESSPQLLPDLSNDSPGGYAFRQQHNQQPYSNYPMYNNQFHNYQQPTRTDYSDQAERSHNTSQQHNPKPS